MTLTAVARRRRGARWLLAGGLAVGALWLCAAPALAAGPEWSVAVEQHNAFGICHTPHLEPSCVAGGGFDPFTEKLGEAGETFALESGWNTYRITVTNSGGSTSSGEVTVTDKLPAGISLAGPELKRGEGPEESEGAEASGVGWRCRVQNSGGRAECTTSLNAEQGKPLPAIELHAHVFSAAAEAKTEKNNVVTVSGGGAPSPVTQEAEPKLGPALRFGVHCFAVSIVESESGKAKQPCEEEEAGGTEETLNAGGHPFSESTEAVFNLIPSDRVNPTSQLASAGGSVKLFEVALPPGFLGNPLSLPRCPLIILKLSGRSGCPANTTIGFINVALPSFGAPEIIEGRTQPLRGGEIRIYNMQPPPGAPAAFGFVFSNQAIPLLIEARVRSDGDYGVTAGDEAIGEKPFAFRATLCEFGAQALPAGGIACRKASEALPGSKAFLINPTACSSAPLWTVHASPWTETSLDASSSTATPPVQGCESLQFHPTLEFAPSRPSEVSSLEESGSTRADEPAGMTLQLTVPQAKEAGAPTPPPRATPALKDITMTLPAGMTVSPSAADGLQACTKAQFWPSLQREELERGHAAPDEAAEEEAIASEEKEDQEGKTPSQAAQRAPGAHRHREPAVEATCPAASQVGTVEAFTPLLSGGPVLERIGSRDVCSGARDPRSSHEGAAGAWTNRPTAYSYQWLRNGVPIENANGREYVPVAADAGKALQCQVRASNESGGSAAASQESVGFEEPSPPRPFPPASIPSPSGTASVPNTLTCESGTWAGTTTSFTYQLLRSGEPVTSPGGNSGPTAATSFAYELKPEDEGKVVQCQVTATNASGSVVVDSAGRIIAPEPSPGPPLPGTPLQGQLFVAQPECSPCGNADAEDGKLFGLFLQITDPRDGVVVKLHGTTTANVETGQLKTSFLAQPQQPVELVRVKIKGGQRAALANPQHCETAETKADLTPWNAPSSPVQEKSSFKVDHSSTGGVCPTSLPFNPSFKAGTIGAGATTAGAFTQFSVTFGREDGEQDLSELEVGLPLGLVGKIAAVKECGEAEIHAAERDEGECPAESKIGTAIAGAGPGEHPFFETGQAYLTGPYNGGPFGIVVVTPAVAGPFNLGNIVVRASIRIDPNTAAVTTVSDRLPQFRDGVQLRVRKVNVEVNRPGFMLNPTNCKAQQVTATLGSAEGATAHASSKFQIGACSSLPFSPELTAEASGQGSKVNGTSFTVRVKAAPGQANIAKTFLQLPLQLPSRLSTIQKACIDKVFEANPASCPEGSNIGMAIAHTPVLKSPLQGPAYLVSHGNASFPDVEFVLQGEGVTIVLDGKTDIKNGITYSRFETVPDAPVETFETVLPPGPHSVLTANVPESEKFSLCNQTLEMPTEITGQNGAVVKKMTHIAVSGCASKPTVRARVRATGTGVTVTVTTGMAGTVWVSGYGLVTVHKYLAAGTHQIHASYTALGRRRHRRHVRTSVRVKLIAGGRSVTQATTVRT